MEMAFGLTGMRKYLENGEKKWISCFFDIEKQLKKNKNHSGYAFPPLEEEVGGLYLMELKSGLFNVKPLTKNINKSFAPHGIS